MTTTAYLSAPFLAWFVCGIIKFLVNCAQQRRFALDLIGYGGFPSNHSAIVSSTAMLIALDQGFNTPSFGVAVTLAFIVVLDAYSLRRVVGLHAKVLNKVSKSGEPLRERIGHTKTQIIFGIFLGCATAALMYKFAGD